MKTVLTYGQPQNSPVGCYPFAIDADYGLGVGVIKLMF